MKDKKKRNEIRKTNEEIDENIFDMCNVCSMTDCTGLIQIVPQTAEEQEAYEDLYPYKPPFIPVCEDKKS